MLSLTLALVLAQSPAPAASPAPADPTPAAESAAPAPAPAPTPAAAPELRRLDFLAGDWVHQETYHAIGDDPAGRGAARSKAIWILDDRHLYVTYKANTSRGTVESRAILGYDTAGRRYRMFWFDNTGAATEYAGDFDGEGNLVLSGERTAPGSARKEQLTFRSVPEGGFRLEGRVAAPDGSWALAQESVAAVFQPSTPSR
jgi:hypothetical protein